MTTPSLCKVLALAFRLALFNLLEFVLLNKFQIVTAWQTKLTTRTELGIKAAVNCPAKPVTQTKSYWLKCLFSNPII
jgi:hypothetical protein